MGICITIREDNTYDVTINGVVFAVTRIKIDNIMEQEWMWTANPENAMVIPKFMQRWVSLTVDKMSDVQLQAINGDPSVKRISTKPNPRGSEETILFIDPNITVADSFKRQILVLI